MSGTSPDSPDCYNCGGALAGPFCAECGQKARPLNPRLADFLHDFTHEILHVDGKIFASVAKLLLAPGFLTREYFEGRRARWVSPIRLYLIFSVLYFAIASLTPPAGLRVRVTGDTDQEQAEALRELGYQNEAELREAVSHTFATWTPRMMFVLVPFFAWLVGLALRSSGRNYPQHLYFALHTHAAWFAAFALGLAAETVLPTQAGNLVSTAVLVYAITYLIFALARAYGRTTRQAFARAAIFVPVYGAAIVVALGVIALMIFGRVLLE